MTEIIPGIERLKIPLPSAKLLLGYVNVYLVKGNDGYLLIDTGWGTVEAFDSLEKQLAERGIDFKDISQIVSTHIHPDHYGLSGKLKQLSGAKVILHRLETNMVDDRYVNVDTLLQNLAKWLHSNGVPDEVLSKLEKASLGAIEFVKPAVPDVTLNGGETISTGTFSFKVLWTPGHSPGHICLYEPDHKILFSGDHILPTISSHIGKHPQSSDNPLSEYIASLKILKPLDVKLVLNGHEEPANSLRERIDELLHHHEHRISEIMQNLKTEPMTAYDIANRITWLSDINGVSFDKLSSWDKRLALLETLSHLELMRVGGKIKKLSRDGIIYYRSL